MPDSNEREHMRKILALPRAYDDEGRELYYSMEYCELRHVVTVDANHRSWCRGDGNKRYEVISTGQIYPKPFPRLESGRR